MNQIDLFTTILLKVSIYTPGITFLINVIKSKVSDFISILSIFGLVVLCSVFLWQLSNDIIKYIDKRDKK